MFQVDQASDFNSKKVHLDNLYRMVSYCENCTDCRRAQQLHYFGERFQRELCKRMPTAVCDTCSSKVILL